MSLRQGNNILAGGVVCDNTPTYGSANAVSSGGVYTALAGKVNTGHEIIAFQAPTAQNNYTWYRKYADGWVEQGGSLFNGTTKTLPVVMADTNYTVTTSFAANTSANTMQWQYVGVTKSTTSISRSANSIDISWYVAGMAA